MKHNITAITEIEIQKGFLIFSIFKAIRWWLLKSNLGLAKCIIELMIIFKFEQMSKQLHFGY